MEEQRMKQDAIPLTGLISKVKEISGLMPVVKKVFNRVCDHELQVNRMLDRLANEMVSETQLETEWQNFLNECMNMVKARLADHDKKIEDKLKILPTEESVAERLDKKASKVDYGNLYKEIADFRLSLGPLIERSWTLRRFVDQVVSYEQKEVNTKDINQKMEQMSYRIKEIQESMSKEIEGCTQRVSNAEAGQQAIREDMIEIKLMAERGVHKKGLRAPSEQVRVSQQNLNQLMPQQAFALGQLPQMPKFDANKVGNTNQATPSPLGFNQ